VSDQSDEHPTRYFGGCDLARLCIAGLAGYLMQREMLNARIIRFVPSRDGRNMAADSETGRCRRAHQGSRLPNSAAAPSRCLHKGAGYLFGTTFDGITVFA